MAIQKIPIDQFLILAKSLPALDVRSPGEFAHAHFPGAYSLPLFTDEERKVVGTAYKQEHKKVAIKIALDYYGVKMRAMVEEVEALLKLRAAKLKKRKTENNNPDATEGNEVLLHCWRGGMRSAGVAWLLDLYGFKVYLLDGGYKAYRQWTRAQFEQPYNFAMVGGYTGSGKTLILHQLQTSGQAVIDLEGLAHHKGSAFGALGQLPQPTQEMFENLLAQQLVAITEAPNFTSAQQIFIEDESQRIGVINIPDAFWLQMRSSPILFLDIPFEDRLSFLTIDYGKLDKTAIVNAIMRIQKRLGGLETKLAINFLLENNHRESFRILLKYYDKYYEKGLYNRDNLEALLQKIPCENWDIKNNAQKLLQEKPVIQKEVT